MKYIVSSAVHDISFLINSQGAVPAAIFRTWNLIFFSVARFISLAVSFDDECIEQCQPYFYF